MLFKVIVKAGSKESRIEFDNGVYKVSLKEKPIEGRANKSLIKLFKKELGKTIRIVRGLRSNEKFIEIVSDQARKV